MLKTALVCHVYRFVLYCTLYRVLSLGTRVYVHATGISSSVFAIKRPKNVS